MKWMRGYANQHSLKTGESLSTISIVIVPDPFFLTPTQKRKMQSGYVRLQKLMIEKEEWDNGDNLSNRLDFEAQRRDLLVTRCREI